MELFSKKLVSMIPPKECPPINKGVSSESPSFLKWFTESSIKPPIYKGLGKSVVKEGMETHILKLKLTPWFCISFPRGIYLSLGRNAPWIIDRWMFVPV